MSALLSAPRKDVPDGGVAIGGPQAGVYPLAFQGGSRLIGRTRLRMGDHVQFVPESWR